MESRKQRKDEKTSRLFCHGPIPAHLTEEYASWDQDEREGLRGEDVRDGRADQQPNALAHDPLLRSMSWHHSGWS